MIQPVLCLAAEGVIRDAESNSVSFFNLLEAVEAKGFPVLMQRMAFFVLWQRAPADKKRHEMMLRVEDAPLAVEKAVAAAVDILPTRPAA